MIHFGMGWSKSDIHVSKALRMWCICYAHEWIQLRQRLRVGSWDYATRLNFGTLDVGSGCTSLINECLNKRGALATSVPNREDESSQTMPYYCYVFNYLVWFENTSFSMISMRKSVYIVTCFSQHIYLLYLLPDEEDSIYYILVWRV